MKTSRNVLALFTLFAAIAQGNPDTQNGTWLATPGSGSWSDSANWQGGLIGDGAGSIVSVEKPASTGDYTIEIDSDRTLGELLQLGNDWPGTYRFTGSGTLHFDTGESTSPARIRLSTSETDNRWLKTFEFTTAVQGTSGLHISGSGRRQYVVWNPAAMNLTGGITLEGVGMHIATPHDLGNNSVTLSGTGLTFLGLSQAGHTYSNNIILDNTSTSGFMNFVSSGSVGTEPPTHTIAGNISQSGGSRSIQYMTATNSAGGTRFIVSGDNSYTGATIISQSQVNGVNLNSGPIVVRATSNTAFGTGSNAVIQILSSQSGIELAENVTISNKTVRLNGSGFRGRGSLNSVSGDNVWAGGVVLRQGTDRADTPTIGVEAGTLTISGTVSDGQSSKGLHKVGEGTLRLTAANSYAAGTIIKEGTLVAAHNSALGTGSVTVDGGALAIAASRTISNTINFESAGGAITGSGTIATNLTLNNLNQTLSPGDGVGTLHLSGNQSWSSFTYLWQLDEWESGTADLISISGDLTFTGDGKYRLALQTLNTAGGHTLLESFDPLQDQTWTILSADTISGFESDNWSIDTNGFLNAPNQSGLWSLKQIENSLTLTYTAIPEPTTVALIGGGAALLLLSRRRHPRNAA